MVVTLPGLEKSTAQRLLVMKQEDDRDWRDCGGLNVHLVIEHLGFTRLGLGNQRLIEHVKHILADLLQLGLDLLTIITDGADVLVGALGLLLLLDRRDDAPRGTSSPDDILISDRQKIPLID